MKYDLSRHPYFVRWEDPKTGIPTYILNERVATVQENFYFHNACLTPDGEYLWFMSNNPPAGGRHIAVVGLNPEQPSIKVFANAPGQGALTRDGHACWACVGNEIWLFPIVGEPSKVAELDPAWVNRRAFSGLLGISVSCDYQKLLVSGKIGTHYFLAIGDPASGKVEILHEHPCHHNHTQFSPHDPNLFMMAQDWFCDPVSGQHMDFDHRTWLMTVDQTVYRPLLPDAWNNHGVNPSHEWWAEDGWICWVDYVKGAFEYHCDESVVRHIWDGPLCHAHCSSDRRYWAADESPYKWKQKPCQLLFFDRDNGQQIEIVSAMPYPSIRRAYEVDTDPHPRFGPDDDCITYTTSVRGTTDVGVVLVDDILARM